ncbi:hypothetical protein AAFF_G00077610 [Aldrovandia affinis]|uniref:Uncharacterized protein n=1 Tax=Aldrovandia affinis TaxID=143900 RepID=A0AAD7RXW8_9TELE|nr:hypothetical protein AAFF_G00077610 [Aldrovandia affinis]
MGGPDQTADTRSRPGKARCSPPLNTGSPLAAPPTLLCAALRCSAAPCSAQSRHPPARPTALTNSQTTSTLKQLLRLQISAVQEYPALPFTDWHSRSRRCQPARKPPSDGTHKNRSRTLGLSLKQSWLLPYHSVPP